MDDPNITMEEYIRLEEEKAPRHGRTFNWQTATFGKVESYEDKDDCFINFETEFPAIVFDNTLISDTAPLCAPTVSPPNKNKIDFRISLDESDDEDYTVIFDENSFSYKVISINDLKTDSENDNDKNNMPSSPKPTVDYLDNLDFFNDFENEFPAVVYNDGLTSKPDLEIGPSLKNSLKFYNLFDHDEEEEAEDDDDPNMIDDVPEIFKIEDNLFNFDTPLCIAFKEFNYLLKINPDLFTYDIQGIKTYDEYEQELNNDKTRGLDEQCNYGVTCQDKAKRRNSGTKMKTFEENCYLLLYVVSSKEDTAYQRQLITRIRVIINSRSGVSLFTYTSYAQLVISQRYKVNEIDGN
ncbi:hypothetical protein Tco_0975595 [Tanacetum coccineum]|uniref:Uncharacterized protein n=1 Tax=Tanacetum coccineum TaxID=301880 RepID=A0ABQ5EEX0_9ASTR